MSLVMVCCCLLTVSVSEKQRTISRAMATRKMKFASVSKLSQWASSVSGSGKIAINAKIIGRRSHAMEFLMDIELCLREIIMMMNSAMAAMVISI